MVNLMDLKKTYVELGSFLDLQLLGMTSVSLGSLSCERLYPRCPAPRAVVTPNPTNGEMVRLILTQQLNYQPLLLRTPCLIFK